MQYVGRALDSVSKTWSSINPATLSGAVDVIVVEQENGDLSCSPFHVRFGKFQLLRPSQKKVAFIVNGQKTNLPMKLGDGGELFFVFETDSNLEIPRDYQTSPVISPASSPGSSPEPLSPLKNNDEPEFLDLGEGASDSNATDAPSSPSGHSLTKRLSYEQAQKLSKRLTIKNIPTKIDQNGDIFLDMQGYKSDDKQAQDSELVIRNLLTEEFGDSVDLGKLIKEDHEGNIMINGIEDLSPSPPLSPLQSDESSFHIQSDTEDSQDNTSGTIYLKSLRLTNDQLRCLKLQPGANDIQFSVNEGRAVVNARMFLWKYNVPIVISDIDGTITKSDALGHVMTMIGKDWTHEGVSKLFTDISLNGYNIMYLTARSLGQLDATRNYLDNICQDGHTLPKGPVILSPDRTFALLRREVILKKPEVFKMSCLNDIRSLYGLSNESKTPFLAGFGNRITDALSYRSVGIPSSRIFTINPDGEVHMELLELAGYKSSYVFITELVDHFFPPVKIETIASSTNSDAASKKKKNFYVSNDEDYTDVNFWREPIPDLSDLSDVDDVTPSPAASSNNLSISSPKLGSQTSSLLPSSPYIDPITRPRSSVSESKVSVSFKHNSTSTTTDTNTDTASSSKTSDETGDGEGDDEDEDGDVDEEDPDYNEDEDEDYIDDDVVIYEDEDEDEDYSEDDDYSDEDYDDEEELDEELLLNDQDDEDDDDHSIVGPNDENVSAGVKNLEPSSLSTSIGIRKLSELTSELKNLKLNE